MKIKNAVGVTFLYLFLISSGLAFPLLSQGVIYVAESETAFKKAVTQYARDNYNEALVAFEALSNSQQIHQRMTAALLMTGKSLYKLGRYADAIPYFDKLVGMFPNSKYVDDALYTRAAANYRLNKSQVAVKDLLSVLDSSEENTLKAKSRKFADFIINSELSGNDLKRLLQTTNNEVSTAFLTIALAKQELESGMNANAVSVLNKYKQDFGQNQFTKQIDQWLNQAEKDGEEAVKIGVILPLSGYFSTEGLGVLRGIKFAHSRVRNSQKPVELVIRDSESNTIKAIHHVKNLTVKEKINAIIGDLESEVTASIGAIAAQSKVPVIGPAATENGVASVAETVFQLNSDLERKGRALANYAIKELGMKTFATLAPADEYGQQMIASFSSAVDELGGRIIAQSWYYGTPEDVSRQFKNIRASAFHYDSTDVGALIREAERKGRKLEEHEIPVKSIDGFFIPIYSQDIKYIAPQFALHNIQTQILGGEYLDDIEILKDTQVERYVNGAIFISDYFPDEDSREFRTFRTEFRVKMKKTPERWEVFGYDACQIILNAINDGASSGPQISKKLRELSGYQGEKGVITFQGNKRVNKEVNFLQFINGKIVKHENKTDKKGEANG